MASLPEAGRAVRLPAGVLDRALRGEPSDRYVRHGLASVDRPQQRPVAQKPAARAGP